MSNNPVMLSNFVKPKEKVIDEPDRYKLPAGIRLVITDFHIAASRQYGKYAKINGYDIITNQKLKYRTTAKQIIEQLEQLQTNPGVDDHGALKTAVKVLVGEYKTENGTGLVLQDAA